MNIKYIGKFDYTSLISLKKNIQNISVVTDEGNSPKLALSKGGSRGNVESQLQYDSNFATEVS